MLLRYRTVITPGRRGAPLLVGLTVGAVLVGVVTWTQPGVAPVAADLSAAVLPGSAAVTLGATPTTTTAPLVATPLVTAPTTTASGPAPDTARPVPTTTRRAAPTTAPATTRPAPRPVPTTTRPAPPATGSPAAQVVALTNAARADAGCAALATDARLTSAAQKHSDDMSANNYFSHTGQDGRSFADRESAEGYPSPGGENIAMGQQSAQEVMTAWLNSPGHRRNIEDCSFTTIGVGLAQNGMYWTQNFGR